MNGILSPELATAVGVYAVAVTVLVELLRRGWKAVDGPWVLLASFVLGELVVFLSMKPTNWPDVLNAALVGLAAAAVAYGGTGVAQRTAAKAKPDPAVEAKPEPDPPGE